MTRRPALDVTLVLGAILLAAVIVLTARPTSGAPGAARALVLRDPLDPHALAAEAIVRRRAGDPRAAALVAFAGRRSRRDWRIEDALLETAIASGRWDEAMDHADDLLRTDADGVLRPAVFPLLDAAAADPAIRGALVRRLTRLDRRPWWREAYLRRLGGFGDPAAAEGVFLALAASPAPPLAGEYRPLLDALVGKGRDAEALAAWRALSRRPDSGDPLRDATFARGGDDTAFTWRRASGAGVWSEVADTGEGPALHVAYDGLSDASLPAQLMVLSPGRYRIVWRARLAGPFRLAWRVRCAGGSRVLADEALGPAPTTGWSDRSLVIDVPADGCPGQWLELIARPGDRRTDVDLWLARFGVSPAARPEPRGT